MLYSLDKLFCPGSAITSACQATDLSDFTTATCDVRGKPALLNPIMFALLTTTSINLLLGSLLGVAGGMLGIGGGLLAIPILGACYGMDQHLAQGTALVLISPNALIGFIRYRQRHQFALRDVAVMCGFSMLAAWFAARLATALDVHLLHLAFAVFLIGLALYFGVLARRMAPHQSAQSMPPAQKVPASAYPLLGLISGAMSGIFTVGGGLIMVPILVSLFKLSQTRAQGIALSLVVPGSFVALCAYAQAGSVSWETGIPMALSGMLSVSAGVVLAHKMPERMLRLLFCSVLLATAAMMLLSR